MRIDLKTIVIIFLVLIIGLLGGYLVGKNRTSSAPVIPAPVSKQVAKEYKDSVAKVIRENGKDIQKCYVEFLDGKPKIQEGKVDFMMKVLENGKIQTFEIIRNELDNEELSKCIKKFGSSWRLPPPPLGLNPYIPHSLAFKSEKTLKQEAEARKKLFPEILPGGVP